MVGLGNIQAMRQIVDFWSTLPLRNKAPNIHVLLGKSENFGNSPGLSPSHFLDFIKPYLKPGFICIHSPSPADV
jgi:hypothetical protein